MRPRADGPPPSQLYHHRRARRRSRGIEKEALDFVKDTSIRAVLEAAVAAPRRSTRSYTVLHPPQHCLRDCKAVASMLTLLAVLTQSNSIETRSTAFGGILPIAEAEYEQAQFNPYRSLTVYRHGTPPHLSDVLVDYGPDKGSLTIKYTLAYQKAIT